ncbi:MAG: methyltransferase domain-containing protein [Pseudomonadota bacterium]
MCVKHGIDTLEKWPINSENAALARSRYRRHSGAVTNELNDIDPVAVCRQARRRRSCPAEHAYVQRRAADAVADRLALLAGAPASAIDVSADGGLASTAVRERYPKIAQFAAGPGAAPERRRWWQRRQPTLLGGNLESLDAADAAMGLAICNLTLPWLNAPDGLFSELARVLSADAPLIVITPGPDTFKELRDAWADVVPGEPPIATFLDMHDLGDALVRAGFVEPVVDVDRLTVRFASADTLWQDLTMSGAGNVLRARRRGLLTPRRLQALQDRLAGGGDGFGITIELTCAHAFAPRDSRRSAASEVRVAAQSIGRRRS